MGINDEILKNSQQQEFEDFTQLMELSEVESKQLKEAQMKLQSTNIQSMSFVSKIEQSKLLYLKDQIISLFPNEESYASQEFEEIKQKLQANFQIKPPDVNKLKIMYSKIRESKKQESKEQKTVANHEDLIEKEFKDINAEQEINQVQIQQVQLLESLNINPEVSLLDLKLKNQSSDKQQFQQKFNFDQNHFPIFKQWSKQKQEKYKKLELKVTQSQIEMQGPQHILKKINKSLEKLKSKLKAEQILMSSSSLQQLQEKYLSIKEKELNYKCLRKDFPGCSFEVLNEILKIEGVKEHLDNAKQKIENMYEQIKEFKTVIEKIKYL